MALRQLLFNFVFYVASLDLDLDWLEPKYPSLPIDVFNLDDIARDFKSLRKFARRADSQLSLAGAVVPKPGYCQASPGGSPYQGAFRQR